MNYQIRPEENVPAYQQLYEQMRRDIATGVYAYGERLPSKRVTAAEAGVSLITVEHAYELLLEEGYAEARERSGYFACYREDDLYSRQGEEELPQMRREHTATIQTQPAYVNTGRDFNTILSINYDALYPLGLKIARDLCCSHILYHGRENGYYIELQLFGSLHCSCNILHADLITGLCVQL